MPYCRMLFIFILIFTLTAGTHAADYGKIKNDTKKIRSSAFKFIQTQQNDDGGYGICAAKKSSPGKTAFVLFVFASSQRKYLPADGPFISRALEYLRTAQNKDGSFGKQGSGCNATLLALAALRACGTPATDPAVSRAEAFVKKEMPNLANASPLALVRHALQTGKATKGSLFTTMEQIIANTEKKSKETTDALATAMKATVTALKTMQQMQDDASSAYGSIPSPENTKGWLSDPVISTATGAWIADWIRQHYPKEK